VVRSRQAFFQRVSASLIVPITFLPLAAILLAIGSQLGIAPVEAGGMALIRFWLPLFFAIGISIGFAENDAMAALSATTGFLVMTAVAEKVASDPALNVGVLGGIVTGAICTWLYNRVKNVSLPEYLALFSGKRMGPIVGSAAGVGLGYLFGFAWPPVYLAIVKLGEWLYASGGAGVFAYGSILRVLIPTGLHHILMNLIDTQIGGWVDPVSGKQLAGEYVRFLAGDPNAGRILSGFFLTLCFGPLGAAMAITHEARPEQRRRVAGLMTTGALTAMLLGVTEPVEFAFIFASPVLFGLHIVLSGLASLLGWALNIHMGGYALPMILFNWHRQQNALLLLPLGLAWTALYYFSFRAVIRWLRPPILGQVPEEEASAPVTGDDEGSAYLQALGGAANIGTLDACMTRLRLSVREPAAVDDVWLRRLGARAVLRPAEGDVQVVVGARAGDIAARVRTAMGGPGQGQGPAVARDSASERSPDRVVTLLSPFGGHLLPLAQVPDQVFSAGLAGQGAAVEATDGTVLSPVAGRVLTVFPGGHALGIITPEGLEVLVHIGVDTVELHGEGFAMTAREGDQVEAGQPLGRFDPAVLERYGKSLASPVLVTNPDLVEAVRVVSGNRLQAGDPLLEIKLKP
jgi:glucose-specific phosphotransferase system IIA component